jgi:hypothetical protein
MPSRDQWTRQMMGDAYGGVSERSRFSAGDPFLGGIGSLAGKLLKKGAKALAKKVLHLPSTGGGAMQMAQAVGPGMEVGAPAAGYAVQRAIAKRGFPSIPGVTSPRMQVFPAGVLATRGRRRRHMNVGNIKALRRAERRVGGFVKLAHRIVTFHKTHHLKHARRRR